MRKMIRIVGNDPIKGDFEYASGLTVTNVNFSLLHAVAAFLAAGRGYIIGAYRCWTVSTADAVNAFSVNNVTGKCYISNTLVAEWDPAIYTCLWGIEATRVLYSAGQTCNLWTGINKVASSSIASATVGLVHEDINPARTAINAMITANNIGFWLAFYLK